jgi:hypothetical protein
MKLDVVMPLVLQHEVMLAATVEAAQAVRSMADMTLYVVCNRLSICTRAMLWQIAARHGRSYISLPGLATSS